MVLRLGVVALAVDLVGVLLLDHVSKPASGPPAATPVLFELKTHFRGFRLCTSCVPLSLDLPGSRNFRTNLSKRPMRISRLVLLRILVVSPPPGVRPPGQVDNGHKVSAGLSSFSRNHRGWIRAVAGPRDTAAVVWGSLEVLLRLTRVATGMRVASGFARAANGSTRSAVVAVKAFVWGDIFC